MKFKNFPNLYWIFVGKFIFDCANARVRLSKSLFKRIHFFRIHQQKNDLDEIVFAQHKQDRTRIVCVCVTFFASTRFLCFSYEKNLLQGVQRAFA